jgi:hypothetical protein
MKAAEDSGARDWVLKLAAGAAAAEALVLIVALGFSGAPLAPYIIGVLLLKLPFCWLVLHRRPGALLCLLLWEVGGMLAALKAEPTAALRLGEGAVAAVVFALLLASVPLFPPVRLPDR